MQYTIQQGDQLSAIAEKFGYLSFNTIWDHPGNAALKAKRKNPHVLHPGDELIIPEKKVKTEAVATTKVHYFRVQQKRLWLRLAVRDFDDQPVTNTACVLEVEGAVYPLTTDAQGRIEKEIPVTAQQGRLTIPDLDMEMDVCIGHLDPIDETSGWQARLINLGYYHNGVGTSGDQLRHAIEEFQCDKGLSVNGELDGATKAKLLEAHGS